jgi:hypothetical protein
VFITTAVNIFSQIHKIPRNARVHPIMVQRLKTKQGPLAGERKWSKGSDARNYSRAYRHRGTSHADFSRLPLQHTALNG